MVVSSVICLEIEGVEPIITSVLLSLSNKSSAEVCKMLLLFSGLSPNIVVSFKIRKSLSSTIVLFDNAVVAVDDVVVVDGSVELVRSTMDLSVVITKSNPAQTLISNSCQEIEYRYFCILLWPFCFNHIMNRDLV